MQVRQIQDGGETPVGIKLGEIVELSVKSPCLHPVFGPAFTPYTLFQMSPKRPIPSFSDIHKVMKFY